MPGRSCKRSSARLLALDGASRELGLEGMSAVGSARDSLMGSRKGRKRVSGAVAMGWGECVRAGRMGPGSKVGSDLGWPDGDRRAGIGGRGSADGWQERRGMKGGWAWPGTWGAYYKTWLPPPLPPRWLCGARLPRLVRLTLKTGWPGRCGGGGCGNDEAGGQSRARAEVVCGARMDTFRVSARGVDELFGW